MWEREAKSIISRITRNFNTGLTSESEISVTAFKSMHIGIITTKYSKRREVFFIAFIRGSLPLHRPAFSWQEAKNKNGNNVVNTLSGSSPVFFQSGPDKTFTGKSAKNNKE